MTIRIRYLLFAAFFGFSAVAASSAPSTPGMIVSGALVVIFLGVGVWDSGRDAHYYLDDPPKDDAAP